MYFGFQSIFSLSSSTRRTFYLQRSSSGQVVVTGVVPSPSRYVPSFLSRIGSSIPTARRFSSNVAISRFCAFRLSFFLQENLLTSMHSVRLGPTKLILSGTRTAYYATGACNRRIVALIMLNKNRVHEYKRFLVFIRIATRSLYF